MLCMMYCHAHLTAMSQHRDSITPTTALFWTLISLEDRESSVYEPTTSG
jgi:hypothetical protein